MIPLAENLPDNDAPRRRAYQPNFFERMWEQRYWRITAKCCGTVLFAVWVYCGMPMICHSSARHAAEAAERTPTVNVPAAAAFVTCGVGISNSVK